MSVTPVIAVLGTGGTIASQHRAGGVVPAVDVRDLLRPDLAGPHTGGVDVRPRTVLSLDSSAMTPDDQWTLVRAIATELDDPTVTGVVVTHGTDTLEESAMLADLVHDDPRPVVFTGAQRPSDADGADGPGNLAAAVACAADPDSRSRGVLVAFGGRVLPARGTVKVSTSDLRAFDCLAPDLPRRRIDTGGHSPVSARVDVVTVHPGFVPEVITHLAATGARGLVLAGLGSGNVGPGVRDVVGDAIARGTPVVVSTRVPLGEVVATYGGGGGAVDLVAAGAVLSPWLRPPQSRIALAALLSVGTGHDGIAEFFATGPEAAGA
ncbi:asparaginase [Williamsia sp. MIQD14]|uniref:asparaginase n=1 Tax=Williamsia sp. MIQD14 TaxID=3425703 RepID=UPI003DA03F8B